MTGSFARRSRLAGGHTGEAGASQMPAVAADAGTACAHDLPHHDLPRRHSTGYMFMFMGAPPKPMLWWTATHQFHTSSCTGPAT
jgi:hypothetical protein